MPRVGWPLAHIDRAQIDAADCAIGPSIYGLTFMTNLNLNTRWSAKATRKVYNHCLPFYSSALQDGLSRTNVAVAIRAAHSWGISWQPRVDRRCTVERCKFDDGRSNFVPDRGVVVQSTSHRNGNSYPSDVELLVHSISDPYPNTSGWHISID